MAKVTYQGFPKPEDKDPLTPLDVVQGKNLKPPSAVVIASQPIELVTEEGTVIQKHSEKNLDTKI